MRIDLQHIQTFVPQGCRLLDLGCGDGQLLHTLQSSHNVRGYGIEKSSEEIAACIENGVNVIEHDLNTGLKRFPDDSFDVIVMTETLQWLESPQILLRELLRIAQRCIVTFPNMGHWRCRFQLLLGGRMPVAKHLPHAWYNTPNIHLCTFRDFDNLCSIEKMKVLDRSVINANYQKVSGKNMFANLFGATGFYVLERPS